MTILGIDCAPSRASGSTVFDGETMSFAQRVDSRSQKGVLPRQLDEILREAKESSPDVLVCWDAPLTGPSVIEELSDESGAYTQRKIETVVKGTPPHGVSTNGYAGLPHWTLTRAILGLPRVGRFDQAGNLPFELVTDESGRKRHGHNVVEVHPAVALWLWTEPYVAAAPDLLPSGCWKYKANCTKHGTRRTDTLKRLTSVLLDRVLPEQMPAIRLDGDLREEVGQSDDRLDAFVAWLLGSRWLGTDSQVMMLGDLESGSFLVPRTQQTEKWQAELGLAADSFGVSGNPREA